MWVVKYEHASSVDFLPVDFRVNCGHIWETLCQVPHLWNSVCSNHTTTGIVSFAFYNDDNATGVNSFFFYCKTLSSPLPSSSVSSAGPVSASMELPMQTESINFNFTALRTPYCWSDAYVCGETAETVQFLPEIRPRLWSSDCSSMEAPIGKEKAILRVRDGHHRYRFMCAPTRDR